MSKNLAKRADFRWHKVIKFGQPLWIHPALEIERSGRFYGRVIEEAPGYSLGRLVGFAADEIVEEQPLPCDMEAA